MPYSSMKDVNPAIRGLKPPVSLEQANLIARWADEIGKAGSADNPWAVAIAQFKKVYVARGGKWMKKKRATEAKEDAKGEDQAKEVTEEQISYPGRIVEVVKDSKGEKWEVTLLEAGLDKNTGDNRHYWEPEALQAAVHLFEGVKSYDNHLSDEEFHAKPYRPTKELVGIHENVRWDPTGGEQGLGAVKATYHVLEQWLRDKLLTLDSAGKLGAIGLSVDGLVDRVPKQLNGETVKAVTRINKVLSVDVVGEPGAGGKFERLIASKSGSEEVLEMELKQEDLEKLIDTRVEQRLAADPPVKGEENEEEEVKEGAETPGMTEEVKQTLAQAKKLAEDAKKQACATVLDGKLAASKLPEPFQKTLRTQFGGRVFEAKDVDEAIKATREALAETSKTGQVRGLGQADIKLGLNPLEQLQYAADRLFGAKIPDNVKDIPRLSGIRELYLLLTGDYDMRGVFNPAGVRLTEANVTTTTVTSIVKNALNKVLLSAYAAGEPWWRPIVTEDDFTKLQQVTLMKTGGIGDLPTVAEGGGYTELTWPDIEETADWVKKGGYIGVTLEAIDRDDVGGIRRIPRELGAAARRTLSAAIAALFTSSSATGPQMADGYHVFDASNHGNLLTTALSAAQWETVVQAVFKQTDPGSGKRLGLRPSICLVPIELEMTARRIFEQPWSQTVQVTAETLLQGSAKVIAVPEWTDANDWAAVVDPAQCEGICVLYRFGREPELFTADDPNVGSMFTNDEMRIKARFFYALGVADYRPLHKSNV